MDELGLHEVGELRQEVLEDPIAHRSGGREKGRDGCRVPLPWSAEPAEGASFGFGPGGAQPPQPEWFVRYAVSVQAEAPDSALSLYRKALRLRTGLNTDGSFAWVESSPSADILHYRRAGEWHVVANFGAEPVALPEGELLVSSVPVEDGHLPGNATAWLRVPAY